MTAAASSIPEAMAILAVQKLWYDVRPNPAIGIFLVLSTQMVGYGFAGILRPSLVYPAKMLYPANIPTASLLENLHKDRESTQKKMRVFWIAFITLFCWQGKIIPRYYGLVTYALQHFHSTSPQFLQVSQYFA
jgi:hypothetical protein